MDRRDQTAVLGRLCRLLANSGVGVQMRDAVPRLIVRAADTTVDVRMGDDGLIIWGPDARSAGPGEVEFVAGEVLALLDRGGEKTGDE